MRLTCETFSVTASLLTRVASNVLLFYVLAYFMSPTEFGVIMLLYTIATLLSCFIEYGFSTFILSRANDGVVGLLRVFQRVKSARLYLTIILLLTYVFIVLIWPQMSADASLQSVSLAAKVAIFLSCALFINAQTAEITLRAMGRSDKELGLAIVGNAVYVTVTVGCLYVTRDPSLVPLAMLIGRSIHLLNSSFQIERLLRKNGISNEVKLADTHERPLGYLINQRHFAIQVVASTAYLQIDSVLLGLLVTPSSVGLYQLFFRIALGVGIVADASASTRLRKLSLVSVSGATPGKLGIYSDRTSIALSVGVSLLAAVAAFILIWLIVDGYIFNQSVMGFLAYPLSELVTISLLMTSIVFVRFWSTRLGATLTALNFQRIRAIGAIIALVFVCTLCGILIPVFGILGAAISNLLGNILLLIIYIRALGNERANENSNYKPAL